MTLGRFAWIYPIVVSHTFRITNCITYLESVLILYNLTINPTSHLTKILLVWGYCSTDYQVVHWHCSNHNQLLPIQSICTALDGRTRSTTPRLNAQ